jgi:phage terminase large subunit-like protein
VPEAAFRRLHANQWTSVAGYWLPPSAWQACQRCYEIERGEQVWVGVGVGGTRAASAVIWVTRDLRVGCQVYQGDDAVLDVRDAVRSLLAEFDVRSVAYDPWRFRESALELEAEGAPMVEWPQTDQRMVPACEQLYDAAVHATPT